MHRPAKTGQPTGGLGAARATAPTLHQPATNNLTVREGATTVFTIIVSTLTAAVVGALAAKAGHAWGRQEERQQAAADRAALGLGAAGEIEQIRRQNRIEINRLRSYWAGQTARAHEAGYSEGWEAALSRIHEAPSRKTS